MRNYKWKKINKNVKKVNINGKYIKQGLNNENQKER